MGSWDETSDFVFGRQTSAAVPREVGCEVKEPKFKFGDKVRITSGFYRGVVGIVKYCDRPFRLFKKSEWRYYIEPQSNEIRNKMTRSESGLELVDEVKP